MLSQISASLREADRPAPDFGLDSDEGDMSAHGFLPNPEKEPDCSAHDPGIQLKEGDSSEPHIHQSAIIFIVLLCLSHFVLTL